MNAIPQWKDKAEVVMIKLHVFSISFREWNAAKET